MADALESLGGSDWNGWADQNGITGRMCPECAVQSAEAGEEASKRDEETRETCHEPRCPDRRSSVAKVRSPAAWHIPCRGCRRFRSQRGNGEITAHALDNARRLQSPPSQNRRYQPTSDTGKRRHLTPTFEKLPAEAQAVLSGHVAEIEEATGQGPASWTEAG